MTTLVQSRPATESISVRPERLSVHFRVGMPGLEQYHDYTLVAVDDSALYWLECDDEPSIALPLAEAFTVEPYGLGMNAKNVDLVRFVNARLQQMRDNGEWTAIYNSWLRTPLGPAPAPPKAVYGRTP